MEKIEQQVADAIQRLTALTTCDDMLVPKILFQEDLNLILREVEDLRAALIEQRCAILNYSDRMTLRP